MSEAGPYPAVQLMSEAGPEAPGQYGVANAAAEYFETTVGELSLAEAATLAAIVRSPTRFDPVKNPDASAERTAFVVQQMVKHEWVTPEQAASAMTGG